MSNWLLGIVLGVVQGVSEWLPISSKTQVIFASTYLFGLTFGEAYAFGLFLEAGTFIAAVYYFRREVWGVLKALVGRGNEEERRLLKFLVIVTAFTAIVGVLIYKFVSETLSGPVLGFPMIALGSILIGDGILISLAKGRFIPRKGLKDLRTRELVLLGIVQGISALPGVSRSGATVSAMLLLGINPEDSFKLSFLALIPASVGAAGVTVLFSNLQLGAVVSIVGVPAILIAILLSIIIGVVFIRLLLRFAGSRRIALLTVSLGVLAIFSGIASFLTGAG
ncbi:MAG TPA: undecaprenyl-diphosphate phosphatase [Nitrososphaerales archaeon]|nr:undecaprenyl-diphosphate phosphatase [Nitrososphaerales archaeon]